VRPLPRGLVLLAGLWLAACASRPARTGPREVAFVPPEVAAYYDAPGPVPAARIVERRQTRQGDVLELELPARIAGSAHPEAVAPIRMRWYRPIPDGRRRAAVVVSPILGDDTLIVSASAERFQHEGWHALIVRRAKITYDDARPVEQVEERLRSAVARQRQAVDWLLTQDDVDPARLATFGISAGGIQNALAAGSDDRYVAHVLALAGGPLAAVFAETEERALQRMFARGMAQQGLDREGLRERLRTVIRTDPVLLARHVRPDRVLLVVARFDHSVPTHLGLDLYEALGRPETVFLPFGHYGSILVVPFVQSRAVEFLRRRLEASASPGAP
jgi:hypothetical protein